MARINTNIQSLITQRVLGTNNAALKTSLERLSTGMRINRGSDDPAGLIASERLKNEQKGLNAALSNAERADQIGNIAEGGLQEVAGMLIELQGIVTATANTAGLSREEREANQLSVDSILQTIDRISSSTNFQGQRLLDGGFDYRLSSIASGVTQARVASARYSGASLALDVIVTNSAQQGGLFLSMGAASIDLNTGSALVIEVSGTRGARELSFASGTTISSIRDAINSLSDTTGVTATVSGTGIRLTSIEYGSEEFVSVKVLNAAGLNSSTSGIHRLQAANFNAAATNSGDGPGSEIEFSGALNGVRDAGQDIRATINGMSALGKGRTASVNSDQLQAAITLSAAQSQSLGNVGGSSGSAAHIVGGGAEFMLSGNVDSVGKVGIGLGSIQSRALGTVGIGFMDSLASGKANNLVNGNLNDAQRVVGEASQQIAQMRGRLGSFQKNVVGANIRSTSVALENTAAAASVIRDADFAIETAQLTRSQILVAASTNILSLANQAPNTVLQLLG
jgi:flagellin